MPELAEYAICELMGLCEMEFQDQITCTKRLETFVGEVLVPDAINPTLPQNEIDILLKSMKQDEVKGTWSGRIPIGQLPVLHQTILQRLEWIVTAMLREEIKYLIEFCADDEYAQKLLWRARACLSDARWDDLMRIMGYMTSKHCIPQKMSIFEFCFDNAMDRYRQKYSTERR